MSALWLQADGIRGGEEFDVPPVRPFFFPIRAETRAEAADDGRNGCAGDILVYFWQIRGFLEAPNDSGHRMFRMQSETAGLWGRNFDNLPLLQHAH
jgi:hypothetical protein